jgi:O-methyltransferase
MDNGIIYKIAAGNTAMCDVDRLVNIYWALSSVLTAPVPGEIVELGCNAGKTSVYLQMLIQHFDPTRRTARPELLRCLFKGGRVQGNH